MPKRLRYQVAVSLDGFIAGPNGEADWIVMDPAIDFASLYAEFDTAVMGRKTFDVLAAQGGSGAMPGLEVVVFSRTRPASSRSGVRVVNDSPATVVAGLKARPGRDIWLYGGGSLCRVLVDAGLVDTVEVAVMPVLLGGGVPLLPPGSSVTLELSDERTLPASGIVALAYSVTGGIAPAPRISYVKDGKG
jgi:dihydrofolate reductase